MELYFSPTPNAQRVLIALEEARLPYSLRVVDLYKGEQDVESFRSLNPLGAVPVLVDRDGPGGQMLVLTQSVAICLYIAEKSHRLIPSEPDERVEMFRWMMLAASDIAGTNTAINQLRRSAPEQSEANVGFFEDRLLKYLAACNGRLHNADYLAGEFSLADISLYPFACARRALIARSGTLTHLQAWMARVANRPAVSKAMSIATQD